VRTDRPSVDKEQRLNDHRQLNHPPHFRTQSQHSVTAPRTPSPTAICLGVCEGGCPEGAVPTCDWISDRALDADPIITRKEFPSPDPPYSSVPSEKTLRWRHLGGKAKDHDALEEGNDGIIGQLLIAVDECLADDMWSAP
jgi:hypothetical protein